MLSITMGMPTYCNNKTLLMMTIDTIDSFLATIDGHLDGIWLYENAPPNPIHKKLKSRCDAYVEPVNYVYWDEPFHINRIYNAIIEKGTTSDVIVCANNDVIYQANWLSNAVKYMRLQVDSDESPYVMIEPVSYPCEDDFTEPHRRLPMRDKVPHKLRSTAGYCLILAGWYARKYPFNNEIDFAGQDHIQRAEIEDNGFLTGIVSLCYVKHLNMCTKIAAPDRVMEAHKRAETYWDKYTDRIGVK